MQLDHGDGLLRARRRAESRLLGELRGHVEHVDVDHAVGVEREDVGPEPVAVPPPLAQARARGVPARSVRRVTSSRMVGDSMIGGIASRDLRPVRRSRRTRILLTSPAARA